MTAIGSDQSGTATAKRLLEENVMKNGLSTLEEIRRMADELELQMHLGGMELRDRWRALQPQIAELEELFEHAGARTGAAIERQLSSLVSALRKLRDDVRANGPN